MPQDQNDALTAGRLGLGAYQAYKAAPGILEGAGQLASGDYSWLSNLNFANIGANLGLGLLSGGNPYHSTSGQAGAMAGTLAGSLIPVPGAGFLVGKGLGSLLDKKSVGPGGTWGYDFRTGQPTGLSGDNGMQGGDLEGVGSAYTNLLGEFAAQKGGRLNMDAIQFGWQPQQGRPQISYHLPGGKIHTEEIYDDADVLRGALRSGAIDVSGSGRTWQELVNELGPSYLEEMAKQPNMGNFIDPYNYPKDSWGSDDTGMGTATGPATDDSGPSGSGEGAKGGSVTRKGIKRYATGGYLDGEDGGMDDTVPATIEGAEPAALSHGEFVMPADVVAALGDGNNKAGAKKLDGLIALLRQKKYGRNKQPPPVGLPALLKRAKIV